MLAIAFIISALASVGAGTVYSAMVEFINEERKRKRYKRAADYTFRRFDAIERKRRMREQQRELIRKTYLYGMEL